MPEQNKNFDDEIIRSAYKRLQNDAQKVDTMKAMREIKKGKVDFSAWLRPAVGVASVAVLAATGVLLYSMGSGQKEVKSELAGEPAVTQQEGEDKDRTSSTGRTGEEVRKSTVKLPLESETIVSPQIEENDTKSSVSSARFDDLACGATGVNDASLGEEIDHVFKVERYSSSDCLRSVFYFGKKGSSGAAAGFLQELEEAGHDHTNYLRFDLPGDWRSETFELFADYPDLSFSNVEGGFAAVVDEEIPYLYIDHGSLSTTSYTFLSTPARLVVDTKIESSTPLAPNAKSGIYVGSLLDADERGDCCASISGLANQFEGVGSVELQDSEGRPVKANWRGESLYGDEDSQTNTSSASFSAGNAGWREFSFEIDGVSAGDYVFVFSSSAVSVEEEPDSVLEVPFTVVTDV